jgi:protein CpxP
MKASTTLWIKRIVIGSAVAALPQVLLAREPNLGDAPPCPPDAMQHEGMRQAPPPMPEMWHPAGPGDQPTPPFLLGIELSEAQQDAVFDLMHAQAPVERTLEKKAAKALNELHRLGSSDRFNTKQARALADNYAQALAQLVYNQAENDSKLRALLTPEQRQQVDAPRAAHHDMGKGPAEH